MDIKVLAEKLDISVEELQTRVRALGFTFKPEDTEVDDDLAEMLIDELATEKTQAEKMAEVLEVQQEREIVRKQRKQTAASQEDLEKAASKQTVITTKVDSLEIGEAISVKEFSEKTGVGPAQVIGELMKNGILANINQQIDFDTIHIVADVFGIKVTRKHEAAEYTDILDRNIESLLVEEDSSLLVTRPPVVSVMGHVDHGKTSLLDAIRNEDVVSTESGGITQHIGAYQVRHNGKKITFLDTPGHEAFTSMRARGAQATDIAILVVAADDGVQPQTIEAIHHAKDAGIPIIVAINKIDKEGVNPDKVKGELAEHELNPEEWGGDTIMVEVSALKKLHIDKVLEAVLLIAEMNELKANPNRPAVGTVIETHLDPGLGPVATIVINTGSMRVGDPLVCGDAFGKVKIMLDHNGKTLKKAVPSTPVKLAGLSKTPMSGDILQVCESDKVARDRAEQVSLIREDQRLNSRGMGADQIVAQIKSGKLKNLKIILKADTKGSLEAIRQSLAKIESSEVTALIVHSGVGGITESDVMMASAGGSLICGFHVPVDAQVMKLSKRENVDIKKYTIIYQMLDDVKHILSGMLTPERIDVVHGRAEVRQVFFTKKKEQIIGVKITNGKLKTKSKLRVFRGKDEEPTFAGEILMLRKVDKVVEEVKSPNEAGIKYTGKELIEIGDIVECFEIEERERTLE